MRWDFDDFERVGQYANGEWWVLGPVTIISTTPQYSYDAGEDWHRDGTHVNPDPNEAVQGLDNSMYDNLPNSYRGQYYDHALNVGAKIVTQPQTIPVNSSVVTCRSHDIPGHSTTSNRSQAKRIEVLTVVASVPAANSFRPCYAGSLPKVSPGTVDNVDLSKLSELARPTGVEPPIWDDVANLVDGVWYEAPGKEDSLIMRYSRPTNVMPDYGRDVQSRYYEALTQVMLTGSPEDKQETVIHLVQIGLDRYSMAQQDPATFNVFGKQIHGGHYSGDAGQGCGAKFSIYFAGWLLDDAAMMNFALAAVDPTGTVNMGWQEDDQVFVVEETSPNVTNYGQCGYGPTQSGTLPPGNLDVGEVEWGIKHFQEVRMFDQALSDDAHWTENDVVPACTVKPPATSSNPNPTKNVSYRTCCTANVWWMGNLFSRVIAAERGLTEPDLYRPEFYQYADRYYTEMSSPEREPLISEDPWTFFYVDLFKSVWILHDASYSLQ